ncbi:type IV pilus biogenesis protein EbsA [Gloeobacter kilaueensis]|uniref:Uncharacterized protein n=1 Tax=Gloeobacter kilaueensis (strain ATCC BAA-2537 / CCAP 1431/1 / ULC 316 / JS1) TaxID=1183438 RepID=U5QIZ5_GLOK1|nr:type IV pilus biogenesis protein EbsA [Gloeobacter kilaueensis]AGY57599.1 hypothetical protein GKIL_1353 [Gloeobacter kilaueensis JS1]
MDILKTSPADELAIYLSCYPPARRPYLPAALQLYRSGNLAGERPIEGAEAITFVARWPISAHPTDRICCQIDFMDGSRRWHYALELTNCEWVGYLIELLAARSDAPPALPGAFYRRLLHRQS